jgi:hypothetical protein
MQIWTKLVFSATFFIDSTVFEFRFLTSGEGDGKSVNSFILHGALFREGFHENESESAQ